MTLSVLGSYCPQWPCAARTIPIHCISCSSAALTVRLFSLARARSRFAPVLACALLASLAARWPPRLLLAPFVLPLPARVARRLACCSRFARASPAASRLSLALRAPSARFARQLACCSLRSPCLLLTSHCCACSAHRLASCSRFACRLARGCSPLRLRLLASLAVSPTRPPHSPSPLAFQHFWHGRQWMGFIEKRKRNEKKRKETCVTQKIAAVGGEDPDPRAFCLVFST